MNIETDLYVSHLHRLELEIDLLVQTRSNPKPQKSVQRKNMRTTKDKLFDSTKIHICNRNCLREQTRMRIRRTILYEICSFRKVKCGNSTEIHVHVHVDKPIKHDYSR